MILLYAELTIGKEGNFCIGFVAMHILLNTRSNLKALNVVFTGVL